MAGINVTLGVDGAEYKQGLNRALKEADTFSAGWSKAIRSAGAGNLSRLVVGDQILRRAFQFASSAVLEFAKDNADAQATLRSWDAIGTGIKKAIGEDLVAGLNAALPLVRELAGGFEKMRGAAVNALAGLFSGNPAGESPDFRDIDQERARNRDQLAEIARAKRLEEANLQLGADLNRTAGNEADAARFDEALRYLRARKDIGGRDISQSEKDALLAGERQRNRGNLGAIDRREAERAARERAELEQRASQEAERANRFRVDQAEKARTARDRVGRQLEDNRLEILRSSAGGAEVEEARTRLDFERQILEVRREAGLTPDEKNAYIGQLASQRDQLLAAMVAARVKDTNNELQGLRSGGNVRGLEAGIGSGFNTRGTFGAPAGEFRIGGPESELSRAQKALQKATEDQTRILQEIARNTQSPVAVAQ
mgnify:CR=1 FL=1